MAKKCEVCGKSSQLERKRNLLRGHYNPSPKIRKYANLQSLRTPEGRIRICTRCMKTAAKKPKILEGLRK